MDKKVYRTKFEANKVDFIGDDKAGYNYVLGRISGMMRALCMEPEENGFATAIKRGDNGIDQETYLTVRTTEQQYENFKRYVEALYPGACEFDYKQAKEV